jgi:hypothetical protein
VTDADRVRRDRFQGAAFTVCALTVAAGVAHAVAFRWVCDDPFITFRYVQQFFAGNGLVYNPGERVESYTHPLWLALLLAARAAGAELVSASELLGLAFHGGTLALLAAFSWKLSRGGRFGLPMAALVWAVHREGAIWATGGLETSLFTFLVTLLVYVAAAVEIPWKRRALIAGIVGALVVLARPDGILFAAVTAAFLGRRNGGRALAAFAASFAVLLGPYLLWKLSYYGSLLPTSYYAKSGGGVYFAQGARYIASFVKAYPSTILLPVALLALAHRWLRARGSEADGAPDRVAGAGREQVLLLSMSVIAVYAVLFVARVGGDFMFARFLVPIVPLTYLAVEIAARRLTAARPALFLAILAAVPLWVGVEGLLRDRLFPVLKDGSRALIGDRITDEHAYYTRRIGERNLIETYRYAGEHLARYFQGTQVRVVLGGQASLGYYGRFAYCIERWGLTDPAVAHRVVEKRGRPGHEKTVSVQELIDRGVHFELMMRPSRNDPYREVFFAVGPDHVRGELLIYDRELMDHLGRFPDRISFVDFTEYLDRYLAEAREKPLVDVEADYRTFQDFYFRHNEDPEREARFLEILGRGTTAPGSDDRNRP